MNKLSTLLLLIAVIFALGGCSNTQIKKSDVEKLGYFKDNTYKNNFFKVQMNITSNSAIHNKEEMNKLLEYYKENITTIDPTMKKYFEESLKGSTLNLFQVEKYEPGSPVDSNPSILGMAENIKILSGIKDGKNYLFHVSKWLKKSKYNYDISETKTEVINGLEWGLINCHTEINEIEIFQNYYAIKLNDYAFCIILTYRTDDDLKYLEEMFKSFKKIE